MEESLVKVKDRFIIETRIGGGSFGEVYKGYDERTKKPVAFKIEHAVSRFQLVYHEGKTLKELQNGKRIPKLYWYGRDGQFNFLVMELLGISVEQILERHKYSLPLKKCTPIFRQMMKRIEYLHKHDIIHRDVKCENFVLSRDNNEKKVYIIDFGLSKPYTIVKGGVHIPYRENKGLTGTVRYASINSHLGIESSRRDDIESLIYVFIYMIKGELPWQGITATTRNERHMLIRDRKVKIPIDELCKHCPYQIGEMLAYTRSLKFSETPDYKFLNRKLRDIYQTFSTFGSKSSKVPIVETTPLNGMSEKTGREKKEYELITKARSSDNLIKGLDEEGTVINEQLPLFKDRTLIEQALSQAKTKNKSQCVIF